MEIRNVYDLIDRFECSDLVELELELKGARLHLKREGSVFGSIGAPGAGCGPEAAAYNGYSNPASASAGYGVANGHGAASGAYAAPEETISAPAPAASLKEIKAPLVGTFYAAASPDADPYVQPGQQVKKGDVIGIIEAMKLMNEVTATEDGVVEEILAENGELVEYGQVLVTLR